MTTGTTIRQIRLSWERLKQYDTDGVPGFSAQELEKMPSEDVGGVLTYGREESQLSYEQAASVLDGLTVSKQARTLRAILDEKSAYFRVIANSSLERAYAILQNSKEGPHDTTIIGQGFQAHLLLRHLPEDQKAKLLKRLEVEDPCYFNKVISMPGKIEAWGKSGNPSLPDREMIGEFCPHRFPGEVKAKSSRSTLPDQKGALEVFFRQYAISKPGHKRYLQSLGVGAPAILSLYDPSSKFGVLFHADSFTDVEDTLDKIFQELREAGVPSFSRWRCRIIYGSEEEKLAWRMKDRLSEAGIAFEVERAAAIIGGANVMLDLADGTLYHYQETEHTTPLSEIDKYFDFILKRQAREGTTTATKHPDSL